MLTNWPILVLLVVATNPLLAQSPKNADEAEVTYKPADWSLIDFRDGYRLTKVRIEVRKDSGMEYRNGKVVANAVFEAAEDLKLFQGALQTAKINTPTKSVGAAGITPNAMLEFETTQGKFQVYWNRKFALDNECFASDNSFWSAGLAVLIDRKLREKGFDGLTEEIIEQLSGEKLLKSEKAYYGKKTN